MFRTHTMSSWHIQRTSLYVCLKRLSFAKYLSTFGSSHHTEYFSRFGSWHIYKTSSICVSQIHILYKASLNVVFLTSYRVSLNVWFVIHIWNISICVSWNHIIYRVSLNIWFVTYTSNICMCVSRTHILYRVSLNIWFLPSYRAFLNVWFVTHI